MHVFRHSHFQLSVALLLGASLSVGCPVHAASPMTEKDRAVSALEEDVKSDPNNAELWLHLGFAYRKLEKIDQAQKAFEKATTLNPKTKDAYFMLGLIYESKHQDPQAVQAWKNYMAIETSAEKRDIAQKHIHHLSQ